MDIYYNLEPTRNFVYRRITGCLQDSECNANNLKRVLLTSCFSHCLYRHHALYFIPELIEIGRAQFAIALLTQLCPRAYGGADWHRWKVIAINLDSHAHTGPQLPKVAQRILRARVLSGAGKVLSRARHNRVILIRNCTAKLPNK